MGLSLAGETEMKRLLLAAAAFAALTVLPIAGNASIIENYECGAAKSSPPDNDRDPVYKTKLQTVGMGPKYVLHGFIVDHYVASGNVYSRDNQYRDRRYWSTSISENWSGISIKNPSLSMVGSLMEDTRNRLTRLTYVEKIFRSGRLETTIVSVCHPVEDEG
jgi:hypothetical protein